MNRNDFILELLSMSAEEMNEVIIKNGKGPKPIELAVRVEPDMGNNIEHT